MLPVLRFLAASARHGGALLGCAVFGGVAIPPLANLLHPVVGPSVIGMMTLVLLRVDVAAALAHLRRPVRLAFVVAFHALVAPLFAWAAVAGLGLEPGIAAGVVIAATGCATATGPAFARLLGLDAELTLLMVLATTLLLPLTAPPMVYAMTGLDLALSLPAFMGRLAVVVGLPFVLALAVRQWAGAKRLEPFGPAIDGAIVWLVVLFGFGVMKGLAARIGSDPAWVAGALAAAFATNFGLNLATTLALSPLGWRVSASAGLVGGNRNMALYLAVLPAAADPRIALFFALWQFPLFLSPFLLRPAHAAVAAWAARRGYGQSQR